MSAPGQLRKSAREDAMFRFPPDSDQTADIAGGPFGANQRQSSAAIAKKSRWVRTRRSIFPVYCQGMAHFRVTHIGRFFMSKIISTAILLFALTILPASAQNARSFVSGHGSDSAGCTLAAPCRTFQHAHDQTNSGGEIDVLDAAGYGTLNIN